MGSWGVALQAFLCIMSLAILAIFFAIVLPGIPIVPPSTPPMPSSMPWLSDHLNSNRSLFLHPQMLPYSGASIDIQVQTDFLIAMTELPIPPIKRWLEDE